MIIYYPIVDYGAINAYLLLADTREWGSEKLGENTLFVKNDWYSTESNVQYK